MAEETPISKVTALRVGAAQFESRPCDLDGNLRKHLQLIDQAKGEGVHLLVFPELSLTGYHVGNQAIEIAMQRDDPRLASLARHAGDMTVVLGFVEESVAAQFHNSSIVLHGGRQSFVHRKLNLASYGNLEEDKYFAEGRYVDVVTHHRPWTVSVLICADAWNPGLVHLAALYGATLLVTPVASSIDALGGEFSNPYGWQVALSFYAMMYGMPVIMANQCGRPDGISFWGGSRIIDPRGQTLAQASDEEELIVADLHYADVRKCRFQLPTVRDSNLDLIHREIERLANRLGVPRGMRSH